MEAVRVKAPATTANIASAFDCAGMALELYNEVVVSLNDRDIVIIDGEGKHELSHDSTNLVYRAIAKVADCA
ncbi:MAG: homoserine kinase, partial [Bacillota bacterium]